MSTISSVLSIIIACAAVCVAGAEEPKSSFEDFKQFGELVSGRWAGDITLIADWPGQEKKQGEKITGYATYKFIADGKGIEWDDVGGTTTGKTLITYDASTKYIKAFHVGSDGGNWQTVIWKKSPTEWGWKLVSGGLVDGRKLGGEGSWLFKDGGKTHIIHGKVSLDGEGLPELHDVYTRVNK